jgi:hypothetical protein
VSGNKNKIWLLDGKQQPFHFSFQLLSHWKKTMAKQWKHVLYRKDNLVPKTFLQGTKIKNLPKMK